MDLDIATNDSGADIGGMGEMDFSSDSGDLDSVADDSELTGEALGEDEGEDLDVADEGGEDGEGAEGKAVDDNTAANDGRTLPNDVKQALKAVQASNPTVAGKLRDMFFTNKAYTDVFPTAADAAKARDFLDGVGGEEGFKGLQASLEEWTDVEKAFTEGSPDFVKRLAEASPEGFQKMVPQAINRWAESQPEAYGFFRSSVALNAMSQAGITIENLQRVYNSEGVRDNLQAKVLIEDVFQALTGLKATAAKYQETQAQRNPEREKLDSERKQFETQRQTDFETDLSTKTDSYTTSKAAPFLAQYVGFQQLPEGVKAAIDRDLTTEVGNRLMQIPGFDSRLAGLVKERKGSDALVAVQQQIDKVIQIATKTVVERYTRTGGTQAAKPGQQGKQAARQPGQQRTAAGSVKLNSAPAIKQVDWAKTTKTQYIGGEATLTDGRKAVWG